MPSKPAQPSYCTLPMFHKPQDRDWDVKDGYISTDGHHFSCKNPVAFQPNFHVYVTPKAYTFSMLTRSSMFVIDKYDGRFYNACSFSDIFSHTLGLDQCHFATESPCVIIPHGVVSPVLQTIGSVQSSKLSTHS